MAAPNIVWIFPDSWRQDAFGFRGNPVIQTPNLDRLAERGAVFTRAYCESPVCQPSRASLITGTYPSQHGLHDNEQNPQWGGVRFPPAEGPTIFKEFQAAGYHTTLFGKAHFAQSSRGRGLTEYGLDEAYEETDKYALWRYDTPYIRYLKELGLFEEWSAYVRTLMPWHVVDGRVQPNPNHVPGTARAAADPVLPLEHQLDVFLGRTAAGWVESYDRDQPFFLWFAPVGPHSPWDAPLEMSGRYAPEDIPLGPQGFDGFPDNRWGEYLRWNFRHVRSDELTDETIRLIGRHYYGLCTIVDQAIGRVVEALENAGRERSTWIFFSSDHGELLGDYGKTSKRVFHESSVLVPQMIVPPTGVEPRLTVNAMTQGFDLVASMFDAAGIPWTGGDIQALSLLPVLEGETVGRDVVYSEIAGFLMVKTTAHKLVVHEESREIGAYYELEQDPEERVNLAAGDDPSLVDPGILDLAHRFLDTHRMTP